MRRFQGVLVTTFCNQQEGFRKHGCLETRGFAPARWLPWMGELRTNGTTVSVPAWMTELAAADVRVVEQSRLSIAALLELRRCVSTFLSLRDSPSPTGELDAAPPDGSDSAVRRRQRSPLADTTAGRSAPTAAADGAVDT